MSTQQATTNEDLLGVIQELMQMTGEGFAQTNRRLDEHGRMLGEHGRILEEHGHQLKSLHTDVKELKTELREVKVDIAQLKETVKDLASKHAAYISDISDILDRIIVLEKQSRLDRSEIKELQKLLQVVVDWIVHAARTLKIPIKFPT